MIQSISGARDAPSLALQALTGQPINAQIQGFWRVLGRALSYAMQACHMRTPRILREFRQGWVLTLLHAANAPLCLPWGLPLQRWLGCMVLIGA